MNYSSVLSDCWALGTAYLPLCGLPAWATAFLPGFGGEIIPVGHRRFRILQKLGEGGYAVVLLVIEVPSEHWQHPDPEPRALKKVLVQSGDHFDAVQQEMLIHATVQHHPNILALLDYSCTEGDKPNLQPLPRPGSASHAAASPQPRHPLPPPPISLSTSTSPQLPLGGRPGAGAGPAAAGRSGAAAVAGAPAATSSAPGTADSGVGPRWSIDLGPGGRGIPPRGPSRFAAGIPGFGALAVDMRSGGGAGGGGGVIEGGAGGSCSRVACFVFPVFRDGTLAMELERLRGRGEMLPTREVLSVFGQIARAAAHVHAHGYAHRDIKPLNVLVAINPACRPPSLGGPGNPKQPQGCQQGQQPHQQPQTLAQRALQTGPGRPQSTPGGGTVGIPAAEADVEAAQGLLSPGRGPTAAPAGPRYHCVLMDFGSARLRGVELANRSQALQLQEDAEAHCSAPYRAPELFDAPSPASLDLAACDVWALGATLFHVMYGEPPFQRAMNASGGSLALAVLNCAIGWPKAGAPAYPPELHQLVMTAMAAEPGDRPSAQRLAELADELTQRALADPQPAP